MLKHICFILLFFLPFFVQLANAQNSILDVGIRLQKTVNLYNENGIAVSYSGKRLLPDRLYFGFSYVTSRLGTAFSSNAIKQDNYLVSSSWYLRRKHIIRPFARVNTGYFSANYGDKMFDVLPRKSLLLSSDIGICFETHKPLKISTSLGYNFITGNGLKGPGTLFPVFYQLSITWNLFKNIKMNHRVNKSDGNRTGLIRSIRLPGDNILQKRWNTALKKQTLTNNYYEKNISCSNNITIVCRLQKDA